jgi:thymidylate synthase
MHEEYQYLKLIEKILYEGDEEETRNGKTLCLFGESMKFNLIDGIIPFITTKKLAWKTCFKELIWFINGHTDNDLLKQQKVNIWNANSTREFLDSRGLNDNEEGDLGPVYGHQWRHFNAEYKDRHTDYTGKGVDQLMNLINDLKNEDTRTSRRLLISAWNPCQIDKMALPPCHVLMQFHVRKGKYLSCSLYQRSGDVGLGVPFNIASYSFLTHILAKHCDLKADKFVYFLGNAHIYENHKKALKEQIKREPKTFPMINIKNKHDNINDYSLDDLEFKTSYEYYDAIKMDMIA